MADSFDGRSELTNNNKSAQQQLSQDPLESQEKAQKNAIIGSIYTNS